MILIDCDDNQATRVASLLDERGSLDLDSAASRWRTSGWQGYSEEAQPFDESLAMREQTFNADPIPLYPFKFVIPVAGAVLLLQGFVEIVRCVLCLRDGAWPMREEDVEEVDVDKLKEMVHVKDADIDEMDKYVPPAQRQEGA